MRELLKLQRRIDAERAAWRAYEATRDIAKAAWIERGQVKGDPLYESARRAAWGEYELACARAYEGIAG